MWVKHTLGFSLKQSQARAMSSRSRSVRAFLGSTTGAMLNDVSVDVMRVQIFTVTYLLRFVEMSE